MKSNTLKHDIESKAKEIAGDVDKDVKGAVESIAEHAESLKDAVGGKAEALADGAKEAAHHVKEAIEHHPAR